MKSNALNEHFDNSEYSKESLDSLNRLKNMGLDPEVAAQFEKRILSILDKNPSAEGLVNSELGKTEIAMENTQSSYKRQYRSIIDYASNNVDYNPDEDLLAS